MDGNYSALIEEMTNMIIRPHRNTYLPDKLGPTHLIVKSKIPNDNSQQPAHKYVEVVRRDLALELKNQKIQLSLFTPIQNTAKSSRGGDNRPPSGQGCRKCVVYLHANSGSRIEGLQLVKYVLPYGWSMALFDYRGSGISEGDYTSMGVNESDDLERVIQHLCTVEQMGQLSFWGRSMGAVTILYYLTKQYYSNHKSGVRVSSIVLDSPFSNMRKLMYEIAADNVGLPEFVFLPVVNSITEQLISKMGFNLINELDLVARVRQVRQKCGEWEKVVAKVNCLFLTSTQDKLVNHSHVQLLHREYPFAVKELHYFNGQHNETRSDTLKAKCADFLCQGYGRANEEEMWRVGSHYIKAGNPTMRRSEIASKQQVFEENRKEGLARAKHEERSPKLNQSSAEQQQKWHQAKSQMNNLDNCRNQQEQPKQTIIINNNFNVNFNVYAKLPIDIPEIPPINLKEQRSMTDRLNDNHNYSFKFYMPYTAKVQTKNFQLQVSNLSNTSSLSSSSNYNHSLHSNSYVQPQNAEKEPLYHSTKIEHHSPRMSHPNLQPFQPPKESPAQNKTKQQKEPNRIEIPLIKFDQIENKAQKPYMIARKDKAQGKNQGKKQGKYQGKNQGNNQGNMQGNNQGKNEARFPSNSPKAGECFLSKKDPRAAQKQKLSLSQLRKIQKQVQEKSDLKSSKVLYVTKQKCEKQQQLLNKKDIFQDAQLWKYKSEQNTAQMQRGRQSKDVKTMKTSLMAKRKVNERKNSDNIVGDLMYSQLKKEQNGGQPQNLGHDKQQGYGRQRQGAGEQRQEAGNSHKEGVNSQKRLLYKIKIDHL